MAFKWVFAGLERRRRVAKINLAKKTPRLRGEEGMLC
jgi:hypothetical protein